MAGIGEGEPSASGIGGIDSNDDVGDFDAQIGVESRASGFGLERYNDGSATPSRTAGVWVDLVS
jgi:hypothetical protein